MKTKLLKDVRKNYEIKIVDDNHHYPYWLVFQKLPHHLIVEMDYAKTRVDAYNYLIKLVKKKYAYLKLIKKIGI